MKAKSERTMAHRPKLLDLHDNTPEGVWMAIRRQVDADAEYSRVEIENLKEIVHEQGIELTQLRGLAQGRDVKFAQIYPYAPPESHWSA